jgi:hypothetical protein
MIHSSRHSKPTMKEMYAIELRGEVIYMTTNQDKFRKECTKYAEITNVKFTLGGKALEPGFWQ